MPSFDIVSEVDLHEVANAVDQTSREVSNRFDFKGTSARVEHKDAVLTLHADSEFQIRQVLDILHKKWPGAALILAHFPRERLRPP